MKKVFTILFILAVLLSGMTISYSAHYCQGNFIASRLSLTGKNADCGMNMPRGENKDVQLTDLMCVNEITSCTFSSDYIYTPQVHDPGKTDFQYIEFPVKIISQINVIPASPDFRQLPPGSPGAVKSDCALLCVFRI